MLGHRCDLAAEQPPEDAVPPDGLIHRHDMHQLVIHQRRHALVRGDRLESEVERGDLDGHEVARHRAGRRIARVREVSEKEGDRFRRVVAEQLPLEREGVQERPRHVRDEIRLGAVEVHHADLRRLDRAQLCASATGVEEKSEECPEDGEPPHTPER